MATDDMSYNAIFQDGPLRVKRKIERMAHGG
jgi:hypothetical protein